MSVRKAAVFQEKVMSFFNDNSQTNWGKNQIMTKVNELWCDFLLDELEKEQDSEDK